MPSNSLEQEAMDRVARMYSSFDNRRSSRRPQGQTARPQNPPARPPEPRPDQSEHKPESNSEHRPQPSEPSPPEKDGKPQSILDIFLKDKDESLILLLLVLLMKDGADMNLLVALIYMLL